MIITHGYMNDDALLQHPIHLNQSLSHKLNRIYDQQHFMQEHQLSFNELTRREKEIMTLVAQGFNNPMIAEKLFISRHTVEQHRKNLYRKLGISSFSEVFQYALAFDLI